MITLHTNWILILIMHVAEKKLELLFNKIVDLLENQAIRSPICREIMNKEKNIIDVGESS